MDQDRREGLDQASYRTMECMGYPVMGLTSPEFKYFLWRSYRKMARAMRIFHTKLKKKPRCPRLTAQTPS